MKWKNSKMRPNRTERRGRKRPGYLTTVLLIAAGILLGSDVPFLEQFVPGQSIGTLPAMSADDTAEGDENVLCASFYTGDPYLVLNDNIPEFSTEDHTIISFESYSEQDALGRCGTAFANIGPDLLPANERGSIGMVRPTGWQTVKYDFIDGKYLYNRCHLIGYQLTGENANEKNLITGTRYMNVEGMQPFENRVADYITETGNHVLYRVTPVFYEDNLLADGVIMEAYSVEDKGEGICFNVFVYNVQPGVEIDYTDGANRLYE